ncbi:MAG: serine/threonine protein kinase [Bacteroidales bacterium]|nr:serine/threonine protein kinase [Bacteroidales bacterium]
MPKIPNYHVGRLIAEGGTAKVYWGIDLRSGYPVAIKELKLRYLKNPIIRDKFIGVETQLYLYVNHRNIPRLVDFVKISETGQLYCIMEFIEGCDLEEYIYEKIGLVPEERALPIFLEILETIGYLHKNNILHLDIKTNNIMLLPNGGIKILDLGIASRMSDSVSTGYGTPSFMPPEQSEKRTCGRYTDIFALGIVLFEMLTGKLPFRSDSHDPQRAKQEIRDQIKFMPTPLMNRYYPPISRELQLIVEKALEKLPQNRYQTCEEFANQIKQYMKKRKY